MSIRDWFNRSGTDYVPPVQTPRSNYYVPPTPTQMVPVQWTQTVVTHQTVVTQPRPFYYCSKPNTKRWKK